MNRTMLMVARKGLFLAALLFATVSFAADHATAKNVILLISDGCGFDQMLATDYYQHGETGRQAYQSFPVRLAVRTHSAQGKEYDPETAWAAFDNRKKGATDSAAAATAMAAGIKTYNKAIGVDMERQPVVSIMEHARKAGKTTGVVTSVPLSHATPAAFLAHNPNRDAYAEIAREMLRESRAQVIMGCGHPGYDNAGNAVDLADEKRFQYVGGRELWNDLAAGTAGNDMDGDGQADPWTLIQTREEFQRLASGPSPKRVLGLAQAHTTLQQARKGDRKADAFQVPFVESVPTLVEMTRAALNVLGSPPGGFVLMIEGGAVDYAGHGNQSGRLIEEQMDFNRAVEVVVAWVEEKSSWDETLVIVTADHETGYLCGPGSNVDETKPWKPIVNNDKGNMPGMEWHSPSHTNSLVPLFAKGPQATARFIPWVVGIDRVHGAYIDNTHIAEILRRAIGTPPTP